jgi:hypothetical protein
MVDISYLSKKKEIKFKFPLFAFCKNESYFLPYFFSHYRNIGVDYFLIYDDGSNDKSRDYLLNQEDCDVITSKKNFNDSFGHNIYGRPKLFHHLLKEKIPELLFFDRWNIVVDLDEFLILPPTYPNLHTFSDCLEKNQIFFITSPMVDFYPEKLNIDSMDNSKSPFLNNPYFDGGPYYQYAEGPSPKPLSHGLRYRLWNFLYKNNQDLFKKLHPDIFIMPSLYKCPLMKSGKNIYRVDDHNVNISLYGKDYAALAHFKFYPKLKNKISDALMLSQYHNGSMEYKMLDYLLKNFNDLSLICSATRIYDGANSLVFENLMGLI